MTALAGIPEGPEHSKYKILLQHHDNMLTRRNATSMTIPVQQGIYFEQSKSFFFDQHKTNYFRDFLLPMALLDEVAFEYSCAAS